MSRVLLSLSVGLLFSLSLIYANCMSNQSTQDKLIAMAEGYLISRGLYVVAELNLADQLIDGPKSAAQIAQSLNTNSDATFRLLRMLASHGIFTFNPDYTFALNEISELITTTHPNSLRGFLLHEDEARWQSYGAMGYTIKTGNPSFNYLFKEGYFDYIARDKKRSEQFDKGMASISEKESQQIAESIDFSEYKTIVDVGGGVGGLVSAIVSKYPTTHATIYELPHLELLAKHYIDKKGLADKINIVSGSFLEAVVSCGDLYILKRILHDWDDETCLKILKNCHSAMDANSRILIFDCIVPEGNSYNISKDIDVIMMAIFGGKERTEKDFEKLFAAAGFKLTKATPVPGTMLSAVWATKS